MAKVSVERVVLENDADQFGTSTKVLRALGDLTPEKDLEPERSRRADMSMDKRTLRLVAFPGEFLKPCPGMSGCCTAWRLIRTAAK